MLAKDWSEKNKEIESLKAENERLRNELSEINFNWWQALALNGATSKTSSPNSHKKTATF